MTQAPSHHRHAPGEHDGALPALREVPALPLRFGRHLTAWLLWHTAGVSLIEDAPPPSRRDRAVQI